MFEMKSHAPRKLNRPVDDVLAATFCACVCVCVVRMVPVQARKCDSIVNIVKTQCVVEYE